MTDDALLSAVLDGTTVTATLSSPEQARDLIRSAQEQGGFMLGLSSKPEPFANCTVVLEAEGGFSFSFQARVVQIFDQRPGGLAGAFQLDDWVQSKDDELERTLASATERAGEGEVRGTAPIYRIKKMGYAEKVRLALKADRAERQLLCRDSTPQVLLNLLSNPRVESTDVLQIVKSTHANAGLLQRVAGDRRWASNSEIQAAIVRNPKTPAPIAIRLLELLPTRELRTMAKMGALREEVRRVAFRVYTKRTSRRG